jgi:hypothetical protein
MIRRAIARSYASAGYLPIPANATKKTPLHKWGFLFDQYDFNDAWRDCADADIALILKNIVCVDFDNHGEEPNGRTYYDILQRDYPQVFRGTVIEETQSRGIHVYYRRTVDTPGEAWLLPVSFGDKTINIEVKTGHRLAYCYPSMKNGELSYKLLQGSFEDPVSQLPPLSTLFRYYPAPKPNPQPTYRVKTDIADSDRDKAAAAIVDMYRGNAGVDSKMHRGAVGMARYMAGLNFDRHDIERALKAYGCHGHRRWHKGEIDGIILDAMKNPDRDPLPPAYNHS